MSGLILCSKQSNVPYYIAELNLNIYSIEELSYYLYHHLYLIEDGFFNEKLVQYIEEECKLPKVAEKLRNGIKEKASFGECVKIILTGSAYYNEKELEKIQGTLDEIGNKSMSHRRKARADILMECKKYTTALAAYREVLAKRDRNDSTQFCSDVWYNIGVVYIKMFLFQEALEAFFHAYACCPREELIDDMLRVCLIWQNETEVLKIVGKYKVTDERLQQCRNQVEQERETLTQSSFMEKLQLEAGNIPEEEGQELSRTKLMCYVAGKWKSSYRDEMIG